MDTHTQSIICTCGAQSKIDCIGGQYQYTYKGKCQCGRIWILEDITENLDEDVIEELNEISKSK